MALDKTILKNSIKSAFQAAIGSSTAEEDLAVALSNAFDVFVKSGTVNTSGLEDTGGDTLISDTTIS